MHPVGELAEYVCVIEYALTLTVQAASAVHAFQPLGLRSHISRIEPFFPSISELECRLQYEAMVLLHVSALR